MQQGHVILLLLLLLDGRVLWVEAMTTLISRDWVMSNND